MKHALYKSPIGMLRIEMSRIGLSAITKVDETEEKTPKELSNIVQQLKEYFQGKRMHFEVDLDWGEKKDFDIKVWECLLRIPYGKTTSYGTIAEELGSPKAAQAVGGANARNPIPIIVPCHRVIGKNGDLTGFALGLNTKMKLLQLERPLEFGEQTQLF